jgi:phage tail tube protein FII
MKNLGIVYFEGSMKELARKIGKFFDEYSISKASPKKVPKKHKDKNAYKVSVRGKKTKDDVKDILK